MTDDEVLAINQDPARAYAELRPRWMTEFCRVSAAQLRNQLGTSESINKHEDQVLLWLVTLGIALLGGFPGYLFQVFGKSDRSIILAASWPLGLTILVGIVARLLLSRLISTDLMDAEKRAGQLEILPFRRGFSDQEFLDEIYLLVIGRPLQRVDGQSIPMGYVPEARRMARLLTTQKRIQLAFHVLFAFSVFHLGAALWLIGR